MSRMKDALLDLEIIRDELNYRREALIQFKADTPYSRGGTYPKILGGMKADLARSMIRLHHMLYVLHLTDQPVRAIRVSRGRPFIRSAD